MHLDTFTRAYIEAALWATLDESEPDTGGYPLDDNYGLADLHPDTLAEMAEHCRAFQDAHADLIEGDLAQAGHDFWLTRNGHGAGFWDGDWPEPHATALTRASEGRGYYHLYVGDDDRIYGCRG